MSEPSSIDFFSSIVTRDEDLERVRVFARRPTGERAAAALESLRQPPEALVPEGTPDSMRTTTVETLQRLRDRIPLDLPHRYALEAIIIPSHRPPILIRNGDYTVRHKDWLHLNSPAVKALVKPGISAACRIELPGSDVPFLGTGFLVGDDLLMTNRHVAEEFVDGVGRGARVRLMSEAEPFVDFLKEHRNSREERCEISDVVMVHPHWDMALLRLRGLPKGHPRLTLTQAPPDDMLGREIVVIGYPARDDDRNNVRVQRDVFGEVFDVKRLQPGKIGGSGTTAGQTRLLYSSFEQNVSAMLHNASTLGGNSGSVILDLQKGEVLGLHFAGEYLKFNCGVPAAELAVDARVVDAGVEFSGQARGSMNAWRKAWNRVEGDRQREEVDPVQSDPAGGGASGGLHVTSYPRGDGVIRLSVPLEFSFRLGTPTLHGSEIDRGTIPGDRNDPVEKAVEPFHEEDYHDRSGYQTDHLGIALPLPEVTDLSQVSSSTMGITSFGISTSPSSCARQGEWHFSRLRTSTAGRSPKSRMYAIHSPAERWVVFPRAIPRSGSTIRASLRFTSCPTASSPRIARDSTRGISCAGTTSHGAVISPSFGARTAIRTM